MTGHWRTIDARGLQPPEPFVLTMEALDGLPAGASLLVLLHREPFPLYQVLDEQGYRRDSRWHDDGTFEIVIHRDR
ncbi:MAG TPA: DUF2249 domain-containing protein [Rhodocyclaceae bacterium]